MSSMQKNRYQEMRERHQAEVNDFPLMFAFDARQFAEGLRMNQTYFHGFSSDMDSPEDIWSIPDTMTPFMGRRNPQSRTIRRKRERKRALKPQSRTRGRAAAHPLEILLPNGGVKPLALAMGSVKQISWRNGT